MKHFWRCSSVPPVVMNSWRSPQRALRHRSHANSCEYMGSGRGNSAGRDTDQADTERWH